jgi:hypothetical protein
MKLANLWLGCLVACSARSAADSGDAALSVSLPACTWSVDACPTNIGWQASILLQASDLGAAASFVAIGGQAVGVASSASEPKRVVRIHTTDEAERYGTPYKLFPLPTVDLDLIDVVDGENDDKSVSVYALACRGPNSCSLWQSQAEAPDGSGMQELAGSTLGDKPSALVFDAYLKQPCVLANGLQCFAGSWHQEIADSDLRDVATGSQLSLAVGAHGKSWLRRAAADGGKAAWAEQALAGDAEVTWIAAGVRDEDSFAIGEHGAFAARVASDDSVCAYPADLAAVPGGMLVTRQGQVIYDLRFGQRCTVQQLDVGDILEGTTTHCRNGDNRWFMSKTTVIGSNYCIISQ